jgi:hypothetical protein
MISLRRRAIALPTLAVAALFGACATNDLTQPVHSGGAASTDRGEGDHDNKKPIPCPATARVLIDKLGNATLEVRSGTFDNATNTGTPYGKIQNVEYTVKSPTGRKLLDGEAKVKPANALFTASLTVLQPAVTSSKADDDRYSSSKSPVKPAVLFDPADSVLVTATIMRPSATSTGDNGHHDGESDNNDDALGQTCTASVVAVVVRPADIAVGVERLVDGGTAVPAPNFGDANPGTTYVFAAWVTSPANSLPADVTCSATVTGTSVANYQLTWLTQQVHVNGGGREACRFTLSLPIPDTYTISVTATSAGDPNATNNTATGTIVVKPNGQTIDVFVRSLAVDQGGGLTTAVGQVAADSAVQYVAAIAVKSGGNQTSAPVSCSIKVTNVSTGAMTTVPGTMSGPATSGADALCRFSLTLPSNANADANYQIAVTALTQGVTNLDTNLTLLVNQSAIVRTDVGVIAVQMTVDGVLQAGLTTIAQGKTANYTATLKNTSSRDATVTCVVTAGPPGAPTQAPVLLTTPAQLTVRAGQTATCGFSNVFTQLVAENFTVTVANVVPVDANPDNNVFTFQTTSQSDHTFPGIGISNVHATQRWVTDGKGVPTILNEESASITRITLTFAATTAILGDFTLSGTVTTDGPPNSGHPTIETLSKATWTVPGLTPGQNGSPNCVKGVDPGYTSVNNQQLSLSICAQEVPGQPGTQAIFVEYDSSVKIALNNPDPLTLFGSSLTFNVSLAWTLFGSTVSDHACATLQFQLQDPPTGVTNVYERTQTGLVSVTRNGC